MISRHGFARRCARGPGRRRPCAWRWRARCRAVPLTRNIGCAGSAGPRVTWAMSPRRMMRPFGDEVDGQDVLLGPERAGDTDQDLLVAGLHHACRGDGVLAPAARRSARSGRCRGRPASRSRTRRRRARPGRPRMSILEMSGSCEQLLADVLDVVAQLAVGEAVGGEAVDDAVGVAELVVEAGPDDALRQRAGGCRRPSCAPGTRCPAPRAGGVESFRLTKIVAWPAVV